MTINEFMETVPEHQELKTPNYANREEGVQSIPDNFNELPYHEKHKYTDYRYNHYLYTLDVDKDRGRIFFGVKERRVQRVGRKFFVRSGGYDHYFVLENNRLSIKKIMSDDVVALARMVDEKKYRWMAEEENWPFAFLSKATIIRGILTGTIYSEESLWRAYIKASPYPSNLPWREVRDYVLFPERDFHARAKAPLSDLWEFTTNLHSSILKMNRLMRDARDSSINDDLVLWVDVIEQAIKLGERVNLNWSKKRMEREHQRMTRELTRLSGKIKQTPIYDDPVTDRATIHLLNSEDEVFNEGDHMHHCLYTNYWHDIRDRSILAFRMEKPERCTFDAMVTRDMGTRRATGLKFDQIFCRCDVPVKTATRLKAQRFLREHSEELLAMINRE